MIKFTQYLFCALMLYRVIQGRYQKHADHGSAKEGDHDDVHVTRPLSIQNTAGLQNQQYQPRYRAQCSNAVKYGIRNFLTNGVGRKRRRPGSSLCVHTY